ncbi:MAG: 50S ribosomal protein L9 [Phycisphaerae bacterium]|nr:50S ribosomal protein L9 [Phycisphaerae bacterium]
MKVLLCEDVESLGWYGDVVEVKEGYARNYLIPQRIAVEPTEKKIKDMAEERAKRSEKRELVFAQLKKASEAVDGAEVVIAANVNERGHLFGSVTESQIAENLRAQGFEVPDKFVRLDGHIKEVGQFDVRIKFAADIIAVVKVTVVPEGQIAEAADESTSQTNSQ